MSIQNQWIKLEDAKRQRKEDDENLQHELLRPQHAVISCSNDNSRRFDRGRVLLMRRVPDEEKVWVCCPRLLTLPGLQLA